MIKTLKYIWTFSYRFVTTIFLLFMLYIVVAVALSWIGTSPETSTCQKQEKETIYVASNGMHVKFIFPIEMLEADFLESIGGEMKGRPYISLGWGDRGFYLNEGFWLITGFKALFLKSETVMRVIHLKKPRDSWKELNLCPEELAKLKIVLKDYFTKDKNGKLIRVDGSQGVNDFFYKAETSYSMFKTCNAWVGECLKDADIKTAIWSPFDKGIIYQAEELER